MISMIWRTPPDTTWFKTSDNPLTKKSFHGLAGLGTSFHLNDSLNVQGIRGITTQWRNFHSSFEITVHEFGHKLLDSGHPYPQGSSQGLYSGWSILANNLINLSVNAHESERLCWFEATEITSDATIHLDDYLSTGSALKYPMGQGEFLYFEYRSGSHLTDEGLSYDQASLHYHSVLTNISSNINSSNENLIHDDYGLFLTHIKTAPSPHYIGGSSGNYPRSIFPVVADGKWDWNDYEWIQPAGNIPVLGKVRENPMGSSIRDSLTIIVPSNINPEIIKHVKPGDKWLGGVYAKKDLGIPNGYYPEISRGLFHYFSLHPDRVSYITPYSNPNTHKINGEPSGLAIKVQHTDGSDDLTIHIETNYSNVISGEVSDHNRFWNGEIIINDEVTVEQNNELVILEGTTVKLGSNGRLIVDSDASIDIRGTMQNPVRFERKNISIAWDIISINGSTNNIGWVEVNGGPFVLEQNSQIAMKGDLIIEDNGTLFIEEGAIISAVNGALIETKPGPGVGPGETGGLIIANSYGEPILMQPLDGGSWGGIVINSHQNILNNVHITGVDTYLGAVRIMSGNLNTIKNSTIENNKYGVLVNEVYSATILNNKIINNEQEGLLIIGVLDNISNPKIAIRQNTISNNGRNGVYVFGSTILDFSDNVIENNGQHGIWLSAFSSIYFNYDDYGYNRIKNNNNHQVWLTTTGDAFIGGNQTFGYNTIYHTNQPITNKLIYRLALTGPGYQQASYQVFAQQTYWGGYSVSGGPSSAWFVGNVDYSNHLTSDPTGGSGANSLSQPVAGGGSSQTQSLMSAEMVASVVSDYDGDEMESWQAIRLNERVMEIRDVLAYKPAQSNNARMLHELFSIKMMDPLNKAGLHKLIHDTYLEWSEDPQLRLVNFEGDQAERVQFTRESAMILRVRLAFLNGDYNEAQKLIDRYNSQITNVDYIAALKTGMIIGKIREKQYRQARVILSELLQFKPENLVASWYDSPDYRPLASYLAYHLNDINQYSKPNLFALVESDQQMSISDDSNEELPKEFKLKGNYPNPFNPVTVIPFTLPMQADVLIEVFDISGRRVARITDRQYEAGHHQVSFDAGSLASGVYLIRAVMRSVEGGDHQFTRKMALVK